MNSGGSSRTRLTSKSDFDSVGGPRWSPDGTRIAFSATHWALGTPQSGTHIYSIAGDGTDTRQLTFGPTDDDAPDWSPDGRRIVFVRHSPASLPLAGVANLWTMNADGTGQVPLTVGDFQMGLWTVRVSPLGDWIGFATGSRLWAVRSDGRDLHPITPEPAQLGDGAVYDFTWAALDGSAVIYSRLENERDDPYSPTHTDLLRLDLATGQATPITDMRKTAQPQDRNPMATGPDWSPVPGTLLPGVVDDTLAPVIDLVGGVLNGSLPPPVARSAARSSVKRVRVARGTDLHMLAVDRRGVRSVRVAISRRVGRRCAYLHPRGFGAPRPCTRPLLEPVTGPARWRALARHLKRGRYGLAFWTADHAGNRSRHPQRFAVTVGAGSGDAA